MIKIVLCHYMLQLQFKKNPHYDIIVKVSLLMVETRQKLKINLLIWPMRSSNIIWSYDFYTFQKCKNELEAVLDAVLLKEFICASNILDRRRSEKHMRNHATPNGAF